MMPTLYGIANCDTVKKARAWLDGRGVVWRFHDFRRDGVPEAELRRWIAALGWEALVNRRGTTWRKVDQAMRDSVVDADSAVTLLLAQPSAIRRPVLAAGHVLVVGFDAERYAALLG